MTQLKFVTPKNKLIGAIHWYPIHPTSMNNTNTFVSSDNMGYASILLEQHFNKGELIGKVCHSFLFICYICKQYVYAEMKSANFGFLRNKY